MKFKYLISTAAGLLLSASCAVNASIIQADFLSTDDGFYDTETRLHWVDVNQFSSGTISDMYTQAANMGATLATTAQITELFSNVDDVASFFTVGGTKSSNFIWGYYNDGTAAGPGGQAFKNSDGSQRILADRGLHDAHRFMGAWAVFEVPAPSSLAILGLGLIGLSFRRLQSKA